jgi:hypothetical protein
MRVFQSHPLPKRELLSGLQLHLHAFCAGHGSLVADLLREERAIGEVAFASYTPEALVVPLAAQGLDDHADDGESALHALRCPPLGALRLAVDAPGVPILLDVAHARLEGIAALSAEEVAEVPVLSQRDGVLAEDGRLAVLALGSVELMPVEVTEVAQARIAIVCYRLAFDVGDLLTSCAALNPVEALITHLRRFFEDFEGLEPGSAGEADKAFRMKFLSSSPKSYDSSLDGQLALVAGGSGSLASERPVT